MQPEKAGLATLRAQYGYADVVLQEKEGTVLNCEAALARAVADRDVSKRRRDEFAEAIRILEEGGYADGRRDA